MHKFAAMSLLLAGAQATTSSPTNSPFHECEVGFEITTLAPTLSPSKSPTTSPTTSPTESPTTSAPEPAGVSFTPPPGGIVQNGFEPTWGAQNYGGGLCRCDIFGPETQPFLDLNDTYCGDGHAGLLSAWTGAYHFTCPHCVMGGTSINITCPNDYPTCEILVNLYVCPGCSSSGSMATTGLWPASLSADGWTAARRCTAGFCSDAGQHPFVGFHKRILGGDTEMLPETATDPTMYFSILVKRGVVCEDITDAGDCAAAHLCQWSTTNSNCYVDWCPTQGPAGSGTSCGTCAPGTPSGTCTAGVAPAPDTQPPTIATQPPTIDTQPPTMDTQVPTIGTPPPTPNNLS